MNVEALSLKLRENNCVVTPESIRNLFAYHGLTVKKMPEVPSWIVFVITEKRFMAKSQIPHCLICRLHLIFFLKMNFVWKIKTTWISLKPILEQKKRWKLAASGLVKLSRCVQDAAYNTVQKNFPASFRPPVISVMIYLFMWARLFL